MKFIDMKQLLLVMLVALMTLTSCVKEGELSGEDMENRSLRAWIKKNRPDLLENYQSEGDYYVDVLAWGELSEQAKDNDFGCEPIMDQDTCWMFYTYTGYDLDGNVCVTRRESIARMQGTFSEMTHYVPYLNYCGESNIFGLLEGTYLSTRSVLKLGEQYVKDNSAICRGTDFVMRKGSHVRLYLPSTIAYGSAGTVTDGGYEGQFALDTNVPVIMDIEVQRVVKNPSDNEVEMILNVVNDNRATMGRNVWKRVKIEDEDKIVTSSMLAEESSDDNESDDTEEEIADDDIGYYKALYYTMDYAPDMTEFKLSYVQPHSAELNNPYKSSKSVYSDMAAVDAEINRILIERFGDKVLAADDEKAKAVGLNNSASIWYIGRFLDGFIFDTNIKEIREYVFNDSTEAEALIYAPATDKDDYISAWYHCIPNLRYGRWGVVVTASGYAYGAEGKVGSTSSSTTSYNYYDYSMYYNYTNSYYYSDYYSYPISYTPSYTVDTETDDTVSTEIMPYTPLVFYIFVEPTE